MSDDADAAVDGNKEGELKEAEPETEQELEERYFEENRRFMSDFVNEYKQDSKAAKGSYYQKKLKFNVTEKKGQASLHKMLFRYLEGMQWVLYYYYRGAQHWRWYYPYHYAPMISDLGDNIVQEFLGGQTTITEFKTDDHCSADPKPYTPFQQLLCILPVKSLRHFVPKPYLQLA